jgi:starch synthase
LPEALANTVDRALAAYRDRDLWMQLIQTAMSQDWSWRRSAQEYVDLYEKAVRKHAAAVCSS